MERPAPLFDLWGKKRNKSTAVEERKAFLKRETQPVVGRNWAVIVSTPSDVRMDWIFSELMGIGSSKRRRNLFI